MTERFLSAIHRTGLSAPKIHFRLDDLNEFKVNGKRIPTEDDIETVIREEDIMDSVPEPGNVPRLLLFDPVLSTIHHHNGEVAENLLHRQDILYGNANPLNQPRLLTYDPVLETIHQHEDEDIETLLRKGDILPTLPNPAHLPRILSYDPVDETIHQHPDEDLQSLLRQDDIIESVPNPANAPRVLLFDPVDSTIHHHAGEDVETLLRTTDILSTAPDPANDPQIVQYDPVLSTFHHHSSLVSKKFEASCIVSRNVGTIVTATVSGAPVTVTSGTFVLSPIQVVQIGSSYLLKFPDFRINSDGGGPSSILHFTNFSPAFSWTTTSMASRIAWIQGGSFTNNIVILYQVVGVLSMTIRDYSASLNTPYGGDGISIVVI